MVMPWTWTQLWRVPWTLWPFYLHWVLNNLKSAKGRTANAQGQVPIGCVTKNMKWPTKAEKARKGGQRNEKAKKGKKVKNTWQYIIWATGRTIPYHGTPYHTMYQKATDNWRRTHWWQTLRLTFSLLFLLPLSSEVLESWSAGLASASSIADAALTRAAAVIVGSIS